MVIMAALAVGAGAQDRSTLPLSDAYHACVDHAAGATLPSIACNETEQGAWDTRLNTAFEALVRRDAAADTSDPLGGPATTFRAGQRRTDTLGSAQRAWITYREAECQYEATEFNGSGSRVVESTCLLRITVQRALALQERLTNTR